MVVIKIVKANELINTFLKSGSSFKKLKYQKKSCYSLKVMKVKLVFFASVWLVAKAAVALDISTPEQYKNFVNEVNNGNSYDGQTVYLLNDLDLKSLGAVEPIGKSISTPFMGEFDGKGHVISNLLVESSGNVLGMIGTSDFGSNRGGTTVKNVILDSTCLVHTTSISTSTDWFSIAGIMASCTGFTKECLIEGCVNMAKIAHLEDPKLCSLTMGGIIAGGSSNTYIFTAKNCVNFGDILVETISSHTYIGGIAGYLYSTESKNAYIKGCANYGKLANNACPINSLYLGGIIGFTYFGTFVDNCVSFGSAVEGTVGSKAIGYVGYGGTFGYGKAGLTASNDYWRNDNWNATAGLDKGISTVNCGGFNSSTLLLESGASLYDSLNDNGFSGVYKITFNLNGGTFSNFTIDSNLFITPILYIPDVVKGDTVFCGWYNDSSLVNPVDFSTVKLGDDVRLYAKWYRTLSFNYENCTSINSGVGKAVALPQLSKCGYTFLGWRVPTGPSSNTIYGDGTLFEMPNSDVTLDPVFKANEYPLYFYDSDGSLVENGTVDILFGTIVNNSYFTETVPVKKGFIFDGWTMEDDNEGNSTIKSDYETSNEFTMPCHNVSFTANYISNTIKITFGSKMEEDEITNILKKYVDSDNYVIEKIEFEEGKTQVIIVFKDAESAKVFTRKSLEIVRDMTAEISYIEEYIKEEKEEEESTSFTSQVSFAYSHSPFLCSFFC